MADKVSKISLPTTSGNTIIQTTYDFKDPDAISSFSYDTTNKKFQSSANSNIITCDSQTPVESSLNPITSGAVYSSLGVINATLESLL